MPEQPNRRGAAAEGGVDGTSEERRCFPEGVRYEVDGQGFRPSARADERAS
ncbi:hypothetical protein [Streptomyces griseomycini]|uniref:Uncharacterized protein n=1 Tax=Streptomyces griseomycini TaxID=66895 RepID=A0A7W7LVW0_9ACTN|nr:hypothetical protein [Streptomyces griseomycini]MBB4897444.1 hypothetical protein [Streptomyces griseomycini]